MPTFRLAGRRCMTHAPKQTPDLRCRVYPAMRRCVITGGKSLTQRQQHSLVARDGRHDANSGVGAPGHRQRRRAQLPGVHAAPRGHLPGADAAVVRRRRQPLAAGVHRHRRDLRPEAIQRELGLVAWNFELIQRNSVHVGSH